METTFVGDRSASVRVLVLPGLGGSGSHHWQTLWEARDPRLQRIELPDWDDPSPTLWVAELERSVAKVDPPVVLVAHSLSCALVARWAAGPGSSGRVAAALLVSPRDLDDPHLPPEARRFSPMPLARLPFDAWVVASSDDPYVTQERARHFAEVWGATFVSAGPAGHINADSGHGAWPEGEALLARIIEGVQDSELGSS